MKELVSRLAAKRTVFFGQAESYNVIMRRISTRELVRQLRVAALLYDHVFYAAAYAWQSEAMRTALPFVEGLILSGEILPAIRDSRVTRDTVDYFDARAEETATFARLPLYCIPALASEVARPEQRSVAVELDRIGTRVHLDVGSIGEEYRRLWYEDCVNEKDPFSVYNLFVSYADLPEVEDFLRVVSRVSFRDYFSRVVVASVTHELDLPPYLKRALVDRATDLYLLANANASQSDLLASWRSVAATNQGDRSRLLGPLAFANVDLFVRVLGTCGISARALHALSDHELLSIKYSPEFAAFREVYDRLVGAALDEQRDFTAAVWERFGAQMRAEGRKRKLLGFLRNTERAAALLFTAALGAVVQQSTAASQLILVGSGAGAGLAYFLRGFDRLNSYPIDDLVSYVSRGEYKRRLQGRWGRP